MWQSGRPGRGVNSGDALFDYVVGVNRLMCMLRVLHFGFIAWGMIMYIQTSTSSFKLDTKAWVFT